MNGAQSQLNLEQKYFRNFEAVTSEVHKPTQILCAAKILYKNVSQKFSIEIKIFNDFWINFPLSQ